MQPNAGGLPIRGAMPQITGINNFLNRNFGVPLPKPVTPVSIPVPAASGVMNSSNASMVQPIPQTPKPTTPVKSTSVTHPNGLIIKTDFHPAVNYGDQTTPSTTNTTTSSNTSGTQSGYIPPTTSADQFSRQTGQPNPNYIDPNAPPPPAPLNVGGQVPGLLASGSQTPQEQQTFQGLIGQSQAPGQAYNQAQGVYQGYLGNYNKLLQDQQQSLANIGQEAIPLNFQQGRQQVLANQYAGQISGAGAALNASTAGLGAANTQQDLQQSALTAANSAAQNTAQRGLSASQTAVGAVSPITGIPYGTQTIQPGLLGQSGGGSSGQVQPNDPFYQTLQSYAQMAANGQISAIPSSVTGNPVLNAQMNSMATKINPNYNPITSAAQSGITTQQTGQIAGYQSALQQGQNLQAQLGDLIKTFGLNPNNINAANIALQRIAANVSDPHYKQLQNYVNDIANTYAQVLTPPGGSSTDTSRGIATSMLDATASGTSILDTMKSLDNAARAKIAGVTTPNAGASTNTSSASGFGWNG